MNTKVVFCTEVKRSGTFTKYGHLRRLKSKTYQIGRTLETNRLITIDEKDYLIKKLMFSYNRLRNLRQEIWVVPYE